jgi:cell division cycle protein 37
VGGAPTGQSGPSYQQMLMSLFEEIRKSIKSADGEGKDPYLRELRNHKKKIGEEIVKNEKELAKLEKEEKSKITSEGLHEGFSTSVFCPVQP